MDNVGELMHVFAASSGFESNVTRLRWREAPNIYCPCRLLP